MKLSILNVNARTVKQLLESQTMMVYLGLHLSKSVRNAVKNSLCTARNWK